MWDTYSLPGYGELVLLENYFFLEIYTLIFTGVLLYLSMKKGNILTLVLLALSVVLYKWVTLNIFSGDCCSLQTHYYPSIGELNILIGLITFWNLLGGFIVSKQVHDRYAFIIFLFGAYVLSILNELIIRSAWLRIYSDTITSLLSEWRFLQIPLETYLYIFVWVVLMVTTFKFLHFFLSPLPVNKKPKKIYTRAMMAFVVASIAALLGEILFHPQFAYSGLPPYTKLYQDIYLIPVVFLSLSLLLSIKIAEWITWSRSIISKWYVQWFLAICLSTVFYTLFYFALATYGMFEFVVSGFPIGIAIGPLPLEIFGNIFLINIFLISFVRYFAK